VNLAPGDRVAVTGASGFIGSAVTRQLLGRELDVVALVEPGADPENLRGLPVKQVVGDVRSAESVRSAMSGCRAAFHVAALYRFWARNPDDFYAVNVGGTRNVLAAAADAGVERLVYTSTVGTLGLEGVTRSMAADERSFPDVRHLYGSYKRSKYVAEHEVLRAIAEGLSASLVLPTFPVGPGDRAPTPTGKLVVDFLNGRMPGYVDTMLNVAHVDDVATGHVLALEHGRTGRSYILGGENLTLRALLEMLAGITGLPAPRLKVPRAVSLLAAGLSEVLEGRLLHRHPAVPLEAARMSTSRMAFDDARARSELGYSPRPAFEALRASARWFVASGQVAERRAARIRWSGGGDGSAGP
jgi:dihydroflavonol-4-reductase